MTAPVTQLYADRIDHGWQVAGGDGCTYRLQNLRRATQPWRLARLDPDPKTGRMVGTVVGYRARPAEALQLAMPAEVRSTFRRTLRPHGLL